MQGQHAARVRWSRRRTVILGVVVLVAVTAVAVAAILYRAPVTGSGTIHPPSNIRFAAVSPAADPGTADVCEASLSGDTATVTLEGEAGTYCEVRFDLYRLGNKPLVLQDVRYADNVTEGFVNGGCGTALSSSPDSPSTAFVRFAIPADAVAGPITAQPDAGVFAVKTAEYVAASCPSAA